MKKLLRSAIILLTSFVLLQSCQKEVIKTETIKEITIDTTLTVGSDYLLKLSCYGNEGDVATITESASFAAISQLENETDMFTSVYHYNPSANGAGKTDHITVAVSRADVKDSVMIYLNIAIK